jgi:amino acid adenylation domain-containing protein
MKSLSTADVGVSGGSTTAGLPGSVAPTTLIQMFEAQAARTPDSVALVSGEDQLSFGCLNRQANALACRLREQGVGPEVRVCLCADRSPELVIGILGILKAGGAYVPLDSDYPAAALAFVVEDSRATILLAQRHLAPKLPKHRVPVVWFDNDDRQDNKYSSPITQDNLAYIIYTSGSTGHPKGVMISHANVVSLLQATSSIYDFGPSDVWTLFHSHTFDFSVWEMWGSLVYGGRLVIVPYVVSRSPDTFLDFLGRHQVTVLNQTPSAFLELQPMSPAGLALRYIIFGGEALDPSAIQPWLKQLVAHGTQFVNMYGITETTVHVTWHVVGRNDEGGRNRIPIGGPIDSLRVYVLDIWSEPVPLGVGGEIYVSGDGLARGYWNRPALTAERYVPNPFGPPGARLYRSGDRGRCWDDGCLEYLGRADHQVKLRGFRIEPGEIEAALMRQPGVMQACVILRDDDPGDKRLVGYLVAGDPTLDEESLRTRLADHLPVHMIPSAIVFMDRFPLTANQKLDRSALPKPERRVRDAQQTSGGLRTPTEQMLTGIWEHILQLDGIAIDDNFFEVGGHSLLATQVMSRVRDAFQVDLPLGTLFESPTVAGLAREIDGVQQKCEALPQLPVRATTGSAPLSFSQQRLWFLEQLQPGTAAYNIPRALRLSGRLDIAAVKLALTEIMRRHAILRTRFPVGKKGVPRQQISEAEPMALPVVDVGCGAEALAQRLTWEEAHRPFDLERGPVWRSLLFRLGEADHVLLVIMHHIVSDGWSAEIMDAEFIELYCAASEHRPHRLPELQIQYADFAEWQRRQMDGEVLDRSLAYWKTQLADLTSLQLPLDRPRPPVPTNCGSVCWFIVPADLSSSLRTLSRGESVTLFITLLAGFKVLLARYTGQWDIAVGSDIANRTRSEIEGLIGFFVNSLVLRSKINPEWSFREFLGHLRETTLRAYEYQDVPFEKVV